jgi:hypothetical protein
MLFRRKEPLPDIAHALQESLERADGDVDDADGVDARRWARDNPAKAAATRIPRWRRPSASRRMILEAAPRQEDSYSGD